MRAAAHLGGVCGSGVPIAISGYLFALSSNSATIMVAMSRDKTQP
jgi:hypothetical protein